MTWRYGNFLLRRGSQSEAYAELRRAIEADPQRAALAFSLAYRANPDINEILNSFYQRNKAYIVGVINEAATRESAGRGTNPLGSNAGSYIRVWN